jgi:hypothetical protein
LALSLIKFSTIHLILISLNQHSCDNKRNTKLIFVDYIDNMAAQSTGVSSDAAWLDEILSGK